MPQASIAKIWQAKGNEVCADCPTANPLWVSFLKDSEESKSEAVSVEGLLAVVVCDQCAEHHRSLLSEVKSLKDSTRWTVEELKIAYQSGNAMVNGYYEAVNFKFDKNTISGDDQEKRRAKFIQTKYKHCKYRNDISLLMDLNKLRLSKKKPDEKVSKKTEGSARGNSHDKSSRHKKDKGDKGDKTASELHSKRSSDTSSKNKPEEKASSQYSNLASLVQKPEIPASPTTTTTNDRNLDIDTAKMKRLTSGMAKVTNSINSLDHSTHSGMDQSSQSTGSFQDLSAKVEQARMMSPHVNPAKLNQLAKGMVLAKKELEEDLQDWEKDNQPSSTPDIKGLMAAKQFGADTAKSYDQDYSNLHKKAQELLRKSGN